MKKVYTILLGVFLAVSAFAQDEATENFRSSFVEGNYLMEEFNFSVALDVWKNALNEDPENSNVNYKVGVCLWKLPNKKYESLPYFEKAVKNVSESYDPFSPSEKSAPVEAYFYIAQAFHLHNEFDSAEVYYNEFKNLINHNHEFWSRTDLNIKQCEFGKEMVSNPVDIKVINLGGLVNSAFQDYAPVVSVDESALYFTSKRLRKDSSNLYAKNPEDGEYYEDIYVTYKGEDNAWGEPEPLNFNTSSNEATLSLSANGEVLYVYKVGEKGLGDIYYSELDGMTWTEPKKLGSDINTEYHETHAAVTPDGQRLYFVSNRKGSLRFPDKAHEKVESRDIYFCNKLPTGDWALSQPVTELNTPYHEDGVFIHPDGKSMFFSSEGHQSMGGFDIFVSEFGDDSVWTKPKNIGYPINTTGDDIFFVTSTSGKRAYYSSLRDDGFGEKDIYVISMLSFNEIPLTLLIGKITSTDGSKIPDDIYINVIDNETSEEVGIFKPRARDAKFTIIIPPGSDYHLAYTYEDSVFYEDDIFVPENSAYQEIEKAISLGAIDFSSIKKKEEPLATEPTATHSVKNPSIEGNLKYGAAGAAGVKLNLKDGNQQLVDNTVTDGSGNFEFANLAAGSAFSIAIDPEGGEVPENAQLYLKDKSSGSMLPVSKLANGSFGFETLPFMDSEELKAVEEEDGAMATVKHSVKNPTVEGNLKYGAAGAAGVKLNLQDNEKKIVNNTVTDNSGNFEFTNLTAGSAFSIAIDPEGGEVPANAQLSIKDKASGEMLPVSKLANGSFAFETLPFMETEELKPVEEVEEVAVVAKPKKATPPPAYKTQVAEIDGDKYIIHKVVNGDNLFSISVLYNLKFDVVQTANPDKGELIFEGDEVKLPIPTDVQFYQEFFDYGQKNVKTNGSDYINFISQVEKIVGEKGKATLMITSSSSKVPSTTIDNEKLSIDRAESAKTAVTSSMSSKGIGADKLNFADMSTLVRGPEYQNDANENRATYKNYQYVKIIVK